MEELFDLVELLEDYVDTQEKLDCLAEYEDYSLVFGLVEYIIDYNGCSIYELQEELARAGCSAEARNILEAVHTIQHLFCFK